MFQPICKVIILHQSLPISVLEYDSDYRSLNVMKWDFPSFGIVPFDSEDSVRVSSQVKLERTVNKTESIHHF